jgi:hypothetical protein
MNPSLRAERIAVLREFPDTLEALVQGLSATQLTTPYLAGEWTVAQNVHHLADSHLNSYIRFKLIATEIHPPLKGYDQDRWAGLADAESADLSTSLAILRGLHARWVDFLEAVTDEQWQRSGVHSQDGELTMDDLLKTYANHCHNHLDQIRRTLAAQSAFPAP